MRITQPIDHYILDVLSDGNNYTPLVVWWRLHTNYLEVNPDTGEQEWSPDYVNQKMAELRNNELLRRLEPVDRSGLYHITDLGRAALEHIEETGEGEFTFSDLLERVNEYDGDGE